MATQIITYPQLDELKFEIPSGWKNVDTQRLGIVSADGALEIGQFVKAGSDNEHVAACGANEDMIGIAQSDAAAAEDVVAVALPGGGALVKAAATLSAGAFLKSDASGHSVAAGTARTGGMLLEDAVDNDLCSAMVTIFQQA